MFNKYLLELLQLKILWYNLFWNATMQWCIVWFNQILNYRNMVIPKEKHWTLNLSHELGLNIFLYLLDPFPILVLDVVNPKLFEMVELRLCGTGKFSPKYPQLSSILSQSYCLKQHKTDQSEPVLATCWEHFI